MRAQRRTSSGDVASAVAGVAVRPAGDSRVTNAAEIFAYLGENAAAVKLLEQLL